MTKNTYSRPTLGRILLALLLILLCQPVVAFSSTDASTPVSDVAMKLVQFCSDPKGGLDESAVAILVNYVLGSKQSRQYGLPKFLDSTGAYYEFDTKIAFPRFVEYSYHPLIPVAITRPSSVRYSLWNYPRGGAQQLPDNWKPVPPAGPMVIIHGMQHESDTPNLNTGVYHEYDLKRTLIFLNHNGHQALVSVSKQTGQSDVGKKGIILGNDNNWNYCYTGEPGSPKTGLGWVKTYIYDYFSVGVYVESSTGPNVVTTGVFQWLRAGWTGINFVKSSHILEGLERFARDSKMVLESPRLPAPNQMISTYQRLSNMPADELIKRYTELRNAQRSSAIQIGKISKSEGEKEISLTNTPKEQMCEELMLEYLKATLGKQTPLGKQSVF